MEKTILLACNAGMSSSFIEKALNDELIRRGLKFKVLAKDLSGVASNADEADLILLAPQIGYLQTELARFKKPVIVMGFTEYSQVNGRLLVDKILEKIN